MTTTLPDPRVKSKPELTAERARELFDYDPDTGVLKWKAENLKSRQRGRIKQLKESLFGATRKDGYIVIMADKRQYLAHRVAWLLVYGEWPALQIDHINGNRSDNRICNLRDVDREVNSQNLRKATASNNSSSFLGVTKHRNKWRAQICANKKNYHLGVYETEKEASLSYLIAKRWLHGGCTI